MIEKKFEKNSNLSSDGKERKKFVVISNPSNHPFKFFKFEKITKRWKIERIRTRRIQPKAKILPFYAFREFRWREAEENRFERV